MKRILIIEDHYETRQWMVKLVQEVFPDSGVAEAATARQARKLMNDESIWLALVDINLPDGNGIDLIREFRSADKSALFVVTTIFDDDKHIFAALQAGVNGYLLKDQDKQDIAAALKGIVSDEPPIAPFVARRILTHFQDIKNSHNAGSSQNSEDDDAVCNLTSRESDVLVLIAKGYTRNEIANLLGISVYTVSDYIKSVYAKLRVSSRVEATLEAIRLGFISTGER